MLPNYCNPHLIIDRMIIPPPHYQLLRKLKDIKWEVRNKMRDYYREEHRKERRMEIIRKAMESCYEQI